MRSLRFEALVVRKLARLAQAIIVALALPSCVAGAESFERPNKKRGDAGVVDPGEGDEPDRAPPPPSPSSEGVPCDVEKVLRARCASCHGATPTYGAPMPLVTFEDLHAPAPTKPGKKVYEETLSRVRDAAKPMPQPPNPRLDASELATLEAWVQKGAPRGPRCEGDRPPAPPPEEPLGCTPDVHAKPASPYAMPAGEKDVYACYGFDQTVSSKRHATAFRIKVDNPKIVHHVLVFQSDKSVSSVSKACSASSLAGWRMVYGWSPGSKGRELPEAAGIPIEGTTHWVVQVHYNNAKGLSGEKDSTGFEMCTTSKLRKYDADMLVWGTTNIEIPPKRKIEQTCSFRASWLPPITIVSGSPHMHGLGKSFTTTLRKKNGTTVDLGSTAAFDWGNQQAYPIAPGTVVEPDDTVITRCVWENSTSNTVRFGEGTDDEMCFNFAMYYPKIKQPLWSWVAPAILSSCTTK